MSGAGKTSISIDRRDVARATDSLPQKPQELSTMSLIDQVFTICNRLAPGGWGGVFSSVAGLDINQSSASALETELARKLDAVDRAQPGFEDFHTGGVRGIEPASPAMSLLYHGLASPGVRATATRTITTWPTLADLDVIENYIFAAAKRSVDDIRLIADGAPLAVVVFNYEYRPAGDTVQPRISADLCFSRTGVARVGTTAPKWVDQERGYVPWFEGDDAGVIRTIPARYGAFIAAGITGDHSSIENFGPMNRDFLYEHADWKQYYKPYGKNGKIPSDDALNFWVPLHKLFPGTECLAGRDVSLRFEQVHVNSKLARIAEWLDSLNYDTGWSRYDLAAAPFTVTDGLVTLESNDAGDCQVAPVPQPIVKAVNVPGGSTPLGFPVKKDWDEFVRDAYRTLGDEPVGGWLDSSFMIPAVPRKDGKRPRKAPEYINVRETTAGKNLNTDPQLKSVLQQGGYEAKCYADASADGFVNARIGTLTSTLGAPIPAYSLVSAPHFIPYATQRQIIEWTNEYFEGRDEDWPDFWSVVPWALSEDRVAPNLRLPGTPFRSDDLTATTIVTMPRSTAEAARIRDYGVRRSTALPDSAAGTFAPGWDTSYDVNDSNEPFLAAYGLGSPFPEDAMICAALGSFWPTAAPDITRGFPPVGGYRTVAPLTDTEMGIGGGPSWDGLPAPRIATSSPGVIYPDPYFTDLVQSALRGGLSISQLQQISRPDYESRVLAMYRAYYALGVAETSTSTWSEKADEWSVVSFTEVAATATTFVNAYTEAGVPATDVHGRVFRFRLYQPDGTQTRPQFNEVQKPLTNDTELFVYGSGALKKAAGELQWSEAPFHE